MTAIESIMVLALLAVVTTMPAGCGELAMLRESLCAAPVYMPDYPRR